MSQFYKISHLRSELHGSGYYLYYKCQAFASKGLIACKSNLIGKENIEKKVLQKN